MVRLLFLKLILLFSLNFTAQAGGGDDNKSTTEDGYSTTKTCCSTSNGNASTETVNPSYQTLNIPSLAMPLEVFGAISLERKTMEHGGAYEKLESKSLWVNDSKLGKDIFNYASLAADYIGKSVEDYFRSLVVFQKLLIICFPQGLIPPKWEGDQDIGKKTLDQSLNKAGVSTLVVNEYHSDRLHNYPLAFLQSSQPEMDLSWNTHTLSSLAALYEAKVRQSPSGAIPIHGGVDLRPSYNTSGLMENTYFNFENPNGSLYKTHSEIESHDYKVYFLSQTELEQHNANFKARMQDMDIVKLYPPFSPEELRLSTKHGKRWLNELQQPSYQGYFNDTDTPQWIKQTANDYIGHDHPQNNPRPNDKRDRRSKR